MRLLRKKRKRREDGKVGEDIWVIRFTEWKWGRNDPSYICMLRSTATFLDYQGRELFQVEGVLIWVGLDMGRNVVLVLATCQVPQLGKRYEVRPHVNTPPTV